MKDRIIDLVEKFGLASVAIVVSLILLEISTRILFPTWGPMTPERSDFWHYDSLLGWSGEAGKSGRIFFETYNIGVTLNSQGLRDNEYPLHRTPDKRRMLILGDSFGWGLGVEHQEIFTKVLEKRHPEWEIIDASTSGYSTDQEYLYFLNRGIRFNPDVVLLLFCENDFDGNTLAVNYAYNKPYFTAEDSGLTLHNVPVPTSTLYQKFSRFIVQKTFALGRVYYAVKPLLQSIKHAFVGRSPEWESGVDSCSPGDETGRLKVTARILERINALALSNKERFIVVSVPMRQTCTHVLENMLTPNGIPYLPLDEAFDGTGKKGLVDGLHWNAAGHMLVADAVDAFLHEIGVFSGVPHTKSLHASVSFRLTKNP